jgi:hypothetical protein
MNATNFFLHGNLINLEKIIAFWELFEDTIYISKYEDIWVVTLSAWVCELENKSQFLVVQLKWGVKVSIRPALLEGV